MEYTGKELLVIKDWDDYFENSTSRQRPNCYWCGIPNKMDGDGYIKLCRQDKPEWIYTAWITMILIASKPKGRDNRGILKTTCGEPHTPATLADKARFTEKIYEHAIPILLEIGWLEIDEEYEVKPDGKKLPKKPAKKNGPKFIELVTLFNDICGTSFKGDKKAEGHFNARISSGYTLDDMETAIKNAFYDSFHVENNHKYMTPEYILRDSQLEKWKNMKTAKPSTFGQEE